MKLFSTKFFPLFQQNRRNHHSGVLLSSLFSNKIKIKTKTKTITQSSPSNSLYDRIQTIRDPKTSVVPVLDQWVGEGNTVDKQQLRNLCRAMTEFKRFHHALEICQWMTDCRCLALSSKDVALRLDLIHRIHGIEDAEKYFNNVSNDLKTFNVYRALLSLYVQEASVERAEAIMLKMREMGLATSPFPYNMLINLYIKTEDTDKIDKLMQEMNEKAIPLEKYTARNRIAAYIAASDLSGMERVLNQVEKDHHFVDDWDIYSLAVSGYVKFSLIERALVMLKKMERMIPLLKNKLAFEYLLTIYASTGMKNELYRVWNEYKPPNDRVNQSHACMITCLAKLDDIEGAEKIFEEWESQCTVYDFRVINRLLVAYSKKGLIEKAESTLNKAAEGRKTYAGSWNVLAIGYVEQNQMLKAVEMLKRAISVGRGRWWPTSVTLDPCLDFLEGKGDVGGIEDIIKLLKKPLTRDIYHRWLRTSVAAGDSVSKVLDLMKLDGFSVDEETDKILKTGRSL